MISLLKQLVSSVFKIVSIAVLLVISIPIAIYVIVWSLTLLVDFMAYFPAWLLPFISITPIFVFLRYLIKLL